jgi:hypothetical protein
MPSIASATSAESPNADGGSAANPGRNSPITDEGVAFGSDTAVGMMPMAHSRRGRASVLVIVIYRQEVRPMNAVSTVGAPLQSTIPRLR